MRFNYYRGEPGEPNEACRTEVLYNPDEERDDAEQLLKLLPDFQFDVNESSLKIKEVSVPTIVIEGVIMPRKYIFRLLRGEPLCAPVDSNLAVNKIQTIDSL